MKFGECSAEFNPYENKKVLQYKVLLSPCVLCPMFQKFSRMQNLIEGLVYLSNKICVGYQYDFLKTLL